MPFPRKSMLKMTTASIPKEARSDPEEWPAEINAINNGTSGPGSAKIVRIMNGKETEFCCWRKKIVPSERKTGSEESSKNKGAGPLSREREKCRLPSPLRFGPFPKRLELQKSICCSASKITGQMPTST